jgi:hypothetical protein
MKITITAAQNGYIVQTADTIKNNGIYVYNNLEIIKMLEFIGRVIIDKPVEVKEK